MIDKIKLDDMLWELCRIQDEITHLNESGASIDALKGERRRLMDRILEEATREQQD